VYILHFKVIRHFDRMPAGDDTLDRFLTSSADQRNGCIRLWSII